MLGKASAMVVGEYPGPQSVACCGQALGLAQACFVELCGNLDTPTCK